MKGKTMLRTLSLSVLTALLAGCSGLPSGVTAVTGFEAERYMGTWYEIARLDHSFERGLSNVTAQYTLRPDGRVDVVNRGYHDAEGKWKSARAIAKFSGDPMVGSLRVSFFRPFWADYHIIALDQGNYNYALVTSSTRKYLWLLARTPKLDDDVLKRLLTFAQTSGYETQQLIYPDHNRRPENN